MKKNEYKEKKVTKVLIFFFINKKYAILLRSLKKLFFSLINSILFKYLMLLNLNLRDNKIRW